MAERKRKKLEKKYERVNPRAIRFEKITMNNAADPEQSEIAKEATRRLKEEREMQRDTVTRGI